MTTAAARRSPPWSVDEIVLAMDLYRQCGWNAPDDADPQVVELSRFLGTLPIHPKNERSASFRNPNGVALKIQNLRAIAGGKGMANGSKTDAMVWARYKDDPDALRLDAAAIRAAAAELTLALPTEVEAREGFLEGRLEYAWHARRERHPKLRKGFLSVKAKADTLCCEACGFTPLTSLPELQEAAFEVHHVRPLSTSTLQKATRLTDLSLLCANCHRTIHAAMRKFERWVGVEEIKALTAPRDAKQR